MSTLGYCDIETGQRDVCFPPESGHWLASIECPLCAKSGHYYSLDDFVGAGKHGWRHGEAEHLRSLEIDDQLILRGGQESKGTRRNSGTGWNILTSEMARHGTFTSAWCYSLAMFHKDELLKRARALRSQSEGRGPTKRSLRQLADSYQREAERLSERPGSNVTKPPRAARLSI